MSAIELLRNRRTDDGREPNRSGLKLKNLVSATCAAFLFVIAAGFSNPAISAGNTSAADAPNIIESPPDLWHPPGPPVTIPPGHVPAYLTPLANYQGLWWNAPAASERGWGINIAHQGDTIFATWFTYDAGGKAMWFVMTAPKSAPGIYSGTLYATTGPSFDAPVFDPNQVVSTPVGNATLVFTDVNNGSFSYAVNGSSQTKAITREVFDVAPSCRMADDSLTAATNYQDLWWASPAGSEAGWGINFTHQGDTLFATWFTYDVDGSPMWLVVTAPKIGQGVYAGTLYRTTGPAWNAPQFDPAAVVATAVGGATFTFTDGDNGIFAYTVNGMSQTKPITRQVFSSPGTVCN